MDSIASLNIGVVAFTGVLVIAMAAWLIVGRIKKQTDQNKIDTIQFAIVDYFRKSGIEVSVGALPAPGTTRFIVFIESEPMRQFRLSHIIETSLRDLVHNLHRIELDKIYWRFPIKKPAENTANKDKKTGEDEYITQGLSSRHLPQAEVAEASWENFEQAATGEPKPE
jgi:hypothetical protein